MLLEQMPILRLTINYLFIICDASENASVAEQTNVAGCIRGYRLDSEHCEMDYAFAHGIATGFAQLCRLSGLRCNSENGDHNKHGCMCCYRLDSEYCKKYYPFADGTATNFAQLCRLFGLRRNSGHVVQNKHRCICGRCLDS